MRSLRDLPTAEEGSILFLADLFGGCVECRRDRYLIFRARRHVKGPLTNDGHVQMMYHGHFQTLAALVVVPVVERLDVVQDGEAVFFARFGSCARIKGSLIDGARRTFIKMPRPNQRISYAWP